MLRAHFAIFSHKVPAGNPPAGDATSVPTGVQSILTSLGSPDDPSNQHQLLDASQTQEFDHAAGSVWVVPGGSGACVVSANPPPAQGPLEGQWGPFADCAPNTSVAYKGLFTFATESGDDGHLLVGLVPDGYPQVIVNLQDGSTQTLSVTNNTVVANLPSLPTLISIQAPNGTTVMAFGPGIS